MICGSESRIAAAVALRRPRAKEVSRHRLDRRGPLPSGRLFTNRNAGVREALAASASVLSASGVAGLGSWTLRYGSNCLTASLPRQPEQ